MRQQHQAVLTFVGSYVDEKGFSPTYDEIAAGIGLKSKGKIAHLVSELTAMGKVRRRPYGKRTIEIVKPGDPPPAPIAPKEAATRSPDLTPVLGAAKHVVAQWRDGCLSRADMERLEAALMRVGAA